MAARNDSTNVSLRSRTFMIVIVSVVVRTRTSIIHWMLSKRSTLMPITALVANEAINAIRQSFRRLIAVASGGLTAERRDAKFYPERRIFRGIFRGFLQRNSKTVDFREYLNGMKFALFMKLDSRSNGEVISTQFFFESSSSLPLKMLKKLICWRGAND